MQESTRSSAADLEHARKRPAEFTELSRDLFGAMSTGGRIGFEAVGWFNGGLFDDEETIPLERGEIDVTLKAAALDWSEIDPSIFGTLFERGLDPDKRSQLGAHYTDREKIMIIVEPVIVRPLLAEWETRKSEISATLERAGSAKSRAARTRLRQQSKRALQSYLERLRKFLVLEPTGPGRRLTEGKRSHSVQATGRPAMRFAAPGWPSSRSASAVRRGRRPAPTPGRRCRRADRAGRRRSGSRRR